MTVLKPACVEWMMQSWKMLREKGKMIRKGWTSIGLDKTFDLQFATAAAKKILSGSMSATGIDEKQEDDDISDADAQQVADEEMIQISQLIYKMMQDVRKQYDC